ncbi:unnamed protein product, partial [marine sediment metagenome]
MEIEKIQEIMGNKKLVIRYCSFCNYPLGYFFDD